MAERVDLYNLDRQELIADLATLGLEPFRAKQLVAWLYRERVVDFGVMTDIAKSARALLAERYDLPRPKPVAVQQSRDGTRKYLFELADGSQVESVLIHQPTRYTLCISSQVGCAIGCKFCRTALMGLKRHLKTSEIVGQVLAVQDDIAALRASNLTNPPEFFQNIVFMGMGEPLHNYDNVVRAVRLLNDELGFNFSARKITVSTSGLVPAIRKFGESEAGANLAISLNATTDEVRTRLIPINKKFPLAELLSALKDYPLKRRKRITFEYVMLRDVNDTEDDLERLPHLLRGIPSKVNLIPYNENAGLGFFAPKRENIDRWQRALLNQGINATVRWSKGEDISAACGQLATESLAKSKRTSEATHGSLPE